MAGTRPAPAPAPRPLSLLARQGDYWTTVFRRTWKGAAFSSFAQPLLYVLAMGLVLGDYVDAQNSSVGGADSYVKFLVPGLLAASAMQLAADECMWPVMGRIKWDRAYLAMIATPLRPRDVARAHLGFAAARVALASAISIVVLAPFGVFASVAGALGAWLTAILTGAAFATVIFAISAGAKDQQIFALIFRLVIMPLFLFSGAFFPVDNLPSGLEQAARVTPLYHGVELSRMVALDQVTGAAWGHVAYLLVMAGAGLWWAERRLTSRLVV